MLKMRLQRIGRRNDPTFRVIIADSRQGPKSGKHVDSIGSYNPKTGEIQIDGERAKDWINKGVQVSDTVHNMLVEKSIIEGTKVNVLPKKSPIISETAEEEKAEETAQAVGETAEDSAEETDESADAGEEADTPADEAAAPEKTETEEETTQTDEEPATEAAKQETPEATSGDEEAAEGAEGASSEEENAAESTKTPSEPSPEGADGAEDSEETDKKQT